MFLVCDNNFYKPIVSKMYPKVHATRRSLICEPPSLAEPGNIFSDCINCRYYMCKIGRSFNYTPIQIKDLIPTFIRVCSLCFFYLRSELDLLRTPCSVWLRLLNARPIGLRTNLTVDSELCISYSGIIKSNIKLTT